MCFEKCAITGDGTVNLLRSSLRHLVETGEPLENEMESGNGSDYVTVEDDLEDGVDGDGGDDGDDAADALDWDWESTSDADECDECVMLDNED